MKSKKIVMYFIIVFIVLFLLFVGYFIYNKINKKNKIISEYIPEEEISQTNLRKTIVNLYFLNSDNYELQIETREIDAKKLINNPYEILIYYLMEGPKNKKLLKIIPENTRINNIQKNGDILYLDFSEGFIEEQFLGKEQEELIVKSIVNTLTELTEVNKIKILINGEENKGFPDGELNFNKIFTR